MSFGINDLITPAKLKENFFWLSRTYSILSTALGDATQAVIGTLTNAITAASPTAGGSIIASGYSANFLPATGTLGIGQGSLDVTLASVVAGKVIRINDVAFTCVASGATGNQFNLGSTDTQRATNLAAAINTSTSTGITGKVTASAIGAVVTLKPTDPLDRTLYPVTGDSTFQNSRSYFGGIEWLRYRNLTGGITVEIRGINNSEASDHPAGSPLYFEGSASAWLLRQLQGLIGDGTTAVLGVGSAGAQVVRDLEAVFQDQVSDTKTDHLLAHLLSDSLLQYDQHMGVVGPDVYTVRGLTPSYSSGLSDASISSLNSFLKYWNDPVTGVPFSCLVPYWVGRLYWLVTGGDVLDKKVLTVLRRTALANGTVNGSGAVSISVINNVQRYDASDEDTYNPGYSAGRLQARVTTAGTGQVDITLQCQGQDGPTGKYFGRPSILQLTFAGVLAADTVIVDGITFTAVTGAASALQFDRSGTNAVTAQNFVAAYKAFWNNDPPLDMTADSGVVTIALSSPTADQNNYNLTSSNATRLAFTSGTLTGQTKVTVGGGSGLNIDGYGADSEQPNGVATDDNPRTFASTSGITQKLDMTTVGATIPLVNGVTGDRAHEIVSASGNSTGANGAFVIEALPDWSS